MELTELLMVAGHDAQPYKGMVLKDAVVAVFVEKPLEFALDLMEAVLTVIESDSDSDGLNEDMTEQLSQILTDAHMDGYGKGYMIYWLEEPWDEE